MNCICGSRKERELFGRAPEQPGSLLHQYKHGKERKTLLMFVMVTVVCFYFKAQFF